VSEPAPARAIAALEQPRMMIAGWILTLVFAAIMFGLFAASSTARGEWPTKLFSAVFAVLGVLAPLGMAWKTFGVIKFGDVRLVMLDPLPVAGGYLRAQLKLPERAADARVLSARLMCGRKRRSLSDGYEDLLWDATREFAITKGVATTITIDLPAGLPEAYWHLRVTAQLPGKDFSRTFAIPVLPEVREDR